MRLTLAAIAVNVTDASLEGQQISLIYFNLAREKELSFSCAKHVQLAIAGRAPTLQVPACRNGGTSLRGAVVRRTHMCNTNSLRKRYGFWVLTLVLATSAPMTATAIGSTVWVPPPNGSDDTANIQAALDTCVAKGDGCTVQLAAGTYHTRQLVEYNFQGTFKGAGVGATVIQAIYPLSVNIPDVYFDGECMPNTSTCLWPSLVIFVNGKIVVSDLSMVELAPPGEATTGWLFAGSRFTDLIDTLRFMGNQPTHATVDRVNVQGLTDSSPTTLSGFNLINGIIFVGELPRSSEPFDYYVLSGSLAVRNSSFSTMSDGVAGGQLTSSHFIIGGSPSTGNVFDNVNPAMDLESAEKSDFEISYNTCTGISYAMWVVPYHQGLPHALLPSEPSQYYIHDNKLFTTGQFADGLYLLDEPPYRFIDAMVWNNTIKLQNSLSEGIGVIYTNGTVLADNSISGSDAYDAIGLYHSALGGLINNGVNAVTVDSTVGNAQIFLNPRTSENFVLCATPSDTVLNQGTQNIVVRCQQ